MENAFWNLWELGIVYINMQHTGVFQGMSLASGCANSGGLKHFRQLKDLMLKIWPIKIFFHWIVIFDRLVKNSKKCLTYPSATKDERYKGRGNREKVDQTEGENSQTSKCYQQHGWRNDDEEIPVHWKHEGKFVICRDESEKNFSNKCAVQIQSPGLSPIKDAFFYFNSWISQITNKFPSLV